MLSQAIDFRDESETLHQLLVSSDESVFSTPTQFKGWTIDDVLVHLHVWNQAADWSAHQPEKFATFMEEVRQSTSAGEHHQRVAYRQVGDTRGNEMLHMWRSFYLEMAERFRHADPEQRVKWAGPDMTVAMSITARQMETWSHGQEVFDLLGIERTESDRIRNIVLLGVMTFGWTFDNRRLERPPVKPHLCLTAPSGEIWTWNEPSDTDRIDGTAVDFARVVTQVRNVEDTGLRTTGDDARQWMSIAQCFAGRPETPPAPGTRFTSS